MNEQDFADKIDWEGGPLEALEYGLRSEELTEDGALKDAWVALEQAWIDFEPLVDDVVELIEG